MELNKWLIVAAVIILFAVMVFAVRYISRRYAERKMESWQNDLMQKHYNEVENMYKQMRGWRHDYKNHIAAMKIYLENENYEKLSKYLNELNEDLHNVDTVLKTGNVMMDAILNSKLSLAKANNIQTDATAHVPEETGIKDIDICVVVGNLMDNAIESCLKFQDESKRFIRVYIGLLKKQLYICVTNSAGGEIKKDGKNYFSTKGNGHGFGIKRIDKIVQKYGGFVNRTDETDVFATEITLPMNIN